MISWTKCTEGKNGQYFQTEEKKKSQSSNFIKGKIRDVKKRERTIDRYETS